MTLLLIAGIWVVLAVLAGLCLGWLIALADIADKARE